MPRGRSGGGGRSHGARSHGHGHGIGHHSHGIGHGIHGHAHHHHGGRFGHFGHGHAAAGTRQQKRFLHTSISHGRFHVHTQRHVHTKLQIGRSDCRYGRGPYRHFGYHAGLCSHRIIYRPRSYYRKHQYGGRSTMNHNRITYYTPYHRRNFVYTSSTPIITSILIPVITPYYGMNGVPLLGQFPTPNMSEYGRSYVTITCIWNEADYWHFDASLNWYIDTIIESRFNIQNQYTIIDTQCNDESTRNHAIAMLHEYQQTHATQLVQFENLLPQLFQQFDQQQQQQQHQQQQQPPPPPPPVIDQSTIDRLFIINQTVTPSFIPTCIYIDMIDENTFTNTQMNNVLLQYMNEREYTFALTTINRAVAMNNSDPVIEPPSRFCCCLLNSSPTVSDIDSVESVVERLSLYFSSKPTNPTYWRYELRAIGVCTPVLDSSFEPDEMGAAVAAAAPASSATTSVQPLPYAPVAEYDQIATNEVIDPEKIVPVYEERPRLAIYLNVRSMPPYMPVPAAPIAGQSFPSVDAVAADAIIAPPPPYQLPPTATPAAVATTTTTTTDAMTGVPVATMSAPSAPTAIVTATDFTKAPWQQQQPQQPQPQQWQQQQQLAQPHPPPTYNPDPFAADKAQSPAAAAAPATPMTNLIVVNGASSTAQPSSSSSSPPASSFATAQSNPYVLIGSGSGIAPPPTYQP